jgi:hypothetical protein
MDAGSFFGAAVAVGAYWPKRQLQLVSCEGVSGGGFLRLSLC